MKDLRKMGGIAALYEAAAYMVAIGTELPRPGSRCGGPPHSCPGPRDASAGFWPWSDRVVRMAGDRHVAQRPECSGVKSFSTSMPNGESEYCRGRLIPDAILRLWYALLK
jgi:hypothetical protein